jgi:hypothetical protein
MPKYAIQWRGMWWYKLTTFVQRHRAHVFDTWKAAMLAYATLPETYAGAAIVRWQKHERWQYEWYMNSENPRTVADYAEYDDEMAEINWARNDIQCFHEAYEIGEAVGRGA